MTLFERKLDAALRYIAADSATDREKIRLEICGLLENAPPSGQGLEYEVRRLLLDIGVPEHVKGYRCLVIAICIACQQPELSGRTTKEIYPAVAKELDTMPGRVERDIRHAIEIAWDRCDLDTLHRYFGNTVSPLKGRPTNSEFIARVANIVRQYQQ